MGLAYYLGRRQGGPKRSLHQAADYAELIAGDNGLARRASADLTKTVLPNGKWLILMEEPIAESRLRKTIESYDLRSEHYAARFEDADLRTLRQYFLESLPSRNGWVLDAGCGAGRDCEALMRSGVRVVGCDLSYGLLKIAHSRLPSTPLIQSDIRALPFRSMSFSGVWSCASLVHLSAGQAARALAEFWRVLKPGGALFVTVRHGTGEWREACRYMGERWFHRYSEADMRNALDASGYEIMNVTTEVGTIGGDWVNVYARRSR
ncbi:methyltransferase family protein [Streptomyces sp. SLBN-118]|uniref:class I SAM-dependent methyltransferase n=1 Tax=Streptomyces sp. SLBN-118 TaxID=2768454 RepID=UPI001153F3E5|nr:methyltransferase family protein [Streptomyces sp. SLBN-118]